MHAAHICTCIHTCIHPYIHTCIHTYIHTRTSVYIYIYTHNLIIQSTRVNICLSCTRKLMLLVLYEPRRAPSVINAMVTHICGGICSYCSCHLLCNLHGSLLSPPAASTLRCSPGGGLETPAAVVSWQEKRFQG